MATIMDEIEKLKGECSCGIRHDTAIRDIRIGSGLVREVGQILRENDFPGKILLVADENTLAASHGILESLAGFQVKTHIYKEMRVATIEHVEELEKMIQGEEIGILSVGTGSVNDPCRLAAARQNKMLCIFATAPSMDGFASYGAPLIAGGVKINFPAKSPEVIIGDTRILASAPAELKSAGFGDMVAKYVGLIDWQVSTLLTGEAYCEKVASLTRQATDELMALAPMVTQENEEVAGKIFASLLKTGIGMSFMRSSRPASGAEHIVSHVIECVQLLDGIYPNLHGDDVGVCTLEVLRYYNRLAALPAIRTKKEVVDWEKVYAFYREIWEEVKNFNHPDNIIDSVTPEALSEHWEAIRQIVHSVPSYEECRRAMEVAGCKISPADIGKDPVFFENCFRFSPYMRRRMTLLRLNTMISGYEI